MTVCGKPLRTVLWETRYCARPPHEDSRHRSAAAIEAARQRAIAQPPTGSPVVAAMIRQAREQAAMSRPRLAAVMGVTATAVQLWEEGKRTPSEQSWVQLELALGPLGVVRAGNPEPAAEENADAA